MNVHINCMNPSQCHQLHFPDPVHFFLSGLKRNNKIFNENSELALDINAKMVLERYWSASGKDHMQNGQEIHLSSSICFLFHCLLA